MAVEDEEPLTEQQREETEGRDGGGSEGKGSAATIESILTSALHKRAAKKLGKIGKSKKSQFGSKEELQEDNTVKKKKKKSKASKESETQGNVELALLKESGEEKRSSSSRKEEEHETVISRGAKGKDGTESEEEEKDEDLEAITKACEEVTTPTREYLKTVAVPKKKSRGKGKKTTQHNGRSLGITIHRADRLEGSLLLFPHPVVQVYICDVETGELLQKSSPERKVTSYYERSEVDYILPIMTQPFDVKKERSTYCRWEEQLLFHEPIEHFTSEDPQVVVFFQLMDFPPSPATTTTTTTTSTTATTIKDWVTFAWAFLKIRGANGHINISDNLRLQLWRPRRSSKVGLKELHSWWRSGSRSKYPSTLHVSLQEVTIPLNPQPTLRSMLATQAEGGTQETAQCLDHPSSAESSTSLIPATHKAADVKWSRKPYQSCRVGNFVKHCFPHSENGCFIVKFSHDGLRIACGSQKEVLIYDVLAGQLEEVLCGHLRLIYDICWSSDDTHIVTASGDSTVRVWKVGIGGGEVHNQSEVLAHPSYVYVSRFVPGTVDFVVSGCFDHVIRVWTCSKKGPYTVLQEMTNHLSYVTALCFNTEGDVLYSGDKQGIIFVWDVKISTKGGKKKTKIKILTFKHEAKVPDIVGNTINSISYHPSGYRVLVHTRDSQLRLVNHQHWTVTHSLRGALNVREQLRSCVSPCGSWIVSGSEDRGLFVWNSDTGEMEASFMDLPVNGTISCVDFHPHDHMLAVSSYSKQSPVLILVPSTNPASDTNISVSLEASTSRNQYSSVTSRVSPSPGSILQGLDTYKTVTSRTSVTVEKVHKLFSQEHKNLLSASNTGNSTFCFSSQEKENSLFMMKIQDTKSGHKMMMAREDAILKKLDAVLKMAMEEPLSMTTTTTYNRGAGRGGGRDSGDGLVGQGHLATVLYDYTGSDKRELSLRQGDFVLVIEELNSDWWLVQTADGRATGLVPAPYLKKVTNETELQTPKPSESGKVLVVPSASGELTFLTDSEDVPPRPARARRHVSRNSSTPSSEAAKKEMK